MQPSQATSFDHNQGFFSWPQQTVCSSLDSSDPVFSFLLVMVSGVWSRRHTRPSDRTGAHLVIFVFGWLERDFFSPESAELLDLACLASKCSF